MPKKKITFAEGYPLASYLTDGTTDDDKLCPRCGSDKFDFVDCQITSGQRIGVCRNCGANYIVNPPRYTVIAADRPPDGRMADFNEFTGPMTRQFFSDLAAAETFYQQEVSLLDVGCVQALGSGGQNQAGLRVSHVLVLWCRVDTACQMWYNGCSRDRVCEAP